MKKREDDPYLDELDKMDDLDLPTEEGPEDQTDEGDEPTRVDHPAPSSSEGPYALEADTPTKEILDLSPDIPVQVVIVMGKKSVSVKDLLALRMGHVIDMDRAPLEPVDIVAGGKLIGKGELVNVDGKLGVRILKIIK